MPAQPVEATPPIERLSPAAASVADAFAAAIAKRRVFDEPYRHYLIENCFPKDVADELAGLPFAAPVLDGVSGKRELHNDQRSYDAISRHARCRGSFAVTPDHAPHP